MVPTSTPDTLPAGLDPRTSHCLAHPPADRAARFRAIRAQTEALAAPLAPEDTVVQSMPDVSPAKWHLAHTAWFFETFILREANHGTDELRDGYGFLFNSYYNAVGPRHARPQRGLLSRPLLAEVLDYRREVTESLAADLAADRLAPPLLAAVELGLHHEQQHQELLLTDIHHVLSVNPLRPAYRTDLPETRGAIAPPLRWIAFDGGVRPVGAAPGADAFAFDNESPRHDALVRPFALASRPVTCGEYAAFIADGGYARADLWLSDGWAAAQAGEWGAPLYWERRDGAWWEFTLAGLRPLDTSAPVAHVSYYEADAYARWAGARLPREEEWEIAATLVAGNTADAGALHPRAATATDAAGLAQMIGDVWEWTASPYLAYPGFAAARGALGEYNGKFMCNQFVLRGGSCVTPPGHIRTTYRNFFPPAARWQWSGVRLAQEIPS